MTEEQRPIFNFAEDVAIDLDDLHNEWAKHAHKRKKYADEVAHLTKVVKQQKKLIEVKAAKLKAETAKLTLAFKETNPKWTVQQVTAAIDDFPPELEDFKEDLSNAQNELIEIEYNLDQAKNAVKGMDDKKDALENEVSLWKGNYFATPREKREVAAGKIIEKEIESKKVVEHRSGINKTRKRSRA